MTYLKIILILWKIRFGSKLERFISDTTNKTMALNDTECKLTSDEVKATTSILIVQGTQLKLACNVW